MARKVARPSLTAFSFLAQGLFKQLLPELIELSIQTIMFPYEIGQLWFDQRAALRDLFILIERNFPAKCFRDEDQALLEPLTNSDDAKRLCQMFFRQV